ncbi:MAG: hypothetical protein AAFY28_09135 [Actinomycetota bacterium]
MTVIDEPTCAEREISASPPQRDRRLWRWLAYAGASALGGSPVPTMMRYEDVVDSVTVIGAEA